MSTPSGHRCRAALSAAVRVCSPGPFRVNISSMSRKGSSRSEKALAGRDTLNASAGQSVYGTQPVAGPVARPTRRPMDLRQIEDFSVVLLVVHYWAVLASAWAATGNAVTRLVASLATDSSQQFSLWLCSISAAHSEVTRVSSQPTAAHACQGPGALIIEWLNRARHQALCPR